MQYSKPQLRKLKFVPELEAIEEVSEEEEEESCKKDKVEEEGDDEDAKINDNNGVKPGEKQKAQQKQQ
nr:unnamed protein product [Spirometra erinaceieuropaei]